ncbi:MAG: hypothetical protein Q7R56_03110, partial [Nanoarchaeota archaeon]|nr:hypothetical protein [Nanoarchaeota archaeon]
MTVLLPLGAASKGKLRVVGFMSGSGTNLEKILESQQQPDCPYEVVVIFTDNQQSRAQEISKKSNIPYRENDINQFYQKYQRPRSDMHVRELFDLQTCHLLQP